MSAFRVALCQLDLTAGDLEGNTSRIIEAIETAEEAMCDLAVFPALAVCGYPPDDLLLDPNFVAASTEALSRVASVTRRCVSVVGCVDVGLGLHNAVALCTDGEIKMVRRKGRLSSSEVFSEHRYFHPAADSLGQYVVGDVQIQVAFGNELVEDGTGATLEVAPETDLVVLLDTQAFLEHLPERHEELLTRTAVELGSTLVHVNQAGGQDELVFYGGSSVIDAHGKIEARAVAFREQVLIVDLELPGPGVLRRADSPEQTTEPARIEPLGDSRMDRGVENNFRKPTLSARPDGASGLYGAVVTGTRAYVTKNGFTDVTLGLSGGLDSALVATIAVDALGPGHVHAVAMPSRHSSDHSLVDAQQLSERLGIDMQTIPIEAAHAALEAMLADTFAGHEADLTEENLQARIRGVVLMALSNKFGWLVLTASNKSETAVGYSTVYGDAAGGFAVIKDVYKTQVYELSHWRNTQGDGEVIPASILTKAPSAELRPDQTDDQSLPPYGLLDHLLRGYIEEDRSVAQLIDEGYDAGTVRRVTRLVDRAEHKRRQSPLGVKVSTKAFGRHRRVPLTTRNSL